MSLNKKPRTSASLPHSQRGSMLVIALFVIVVLGLLGLALSKILAASSQSVVYEVYGQRALNAARTGAEVQIALAFPLDPEPSTNPSLCSDTPVFIFSNVPGLENCRYDAICSVVSVVDSGISRNYYQVTSVGTCLAGEILVSRSVYVDGLQ